MALKNIFADASGIELEGVYYMIGSVHDNRLERAVEVRLLAWRNTERRDAFKATLQEIRAAEAALQAAREVHAIAPDGHRTRPWMAVIEAEEGLANAQRALEQTPPMPFGNTFTIKPDEYHTVVDATGSVSVPKLYAWITQQPGWADAVEA